MMKRPAKTLCATLLAIAGLAMPACDLFADLDHRDMLYNNDACQAQANGKCGQ